MCGIIALFGEEVEVSEYKLTHRGPDDYRSKTLGKCRMDFYRLAINDLTDAGMQPFRQGNKMLVCNGEIYNYREFLTGTETSKSDCEVLIPLISIKFSSNSTYFYLVDALISSLADLIQIHFFPVIQILPG